ncbi:Lrp/AsnC family transcriptional regulator [Nocardia sp. CA-119907]|uniref:Lrp/AsnC family transcriptional regulator n=1 Tax=Nocardia sp. CA-119907 TaxID=3239973 RepID=UPI003D983A68
MTAERPTQRGVDEVDVMLLDALHVNPRVSFERLGPALGISPVTAARRWQRLSESGRAWVSSVPGPQVALTAAVYEVRAQPGRILDLAHALAVVPQVVSVYATDGAFDLHTLVLAETTQALSTLLLEQLPRIPGIARAQSHIGMEWYSGIHWRLGAMDTDQQQSVAEPDDNRRRSNRNRTLEPEDRDLFLALQRDGRARFRDLARELDTSEHLVRRRLDSLVRRGMLGFRTDFTRGEGGWPTEFVLWLSVPHHQLVAAGAEIAGWPQTRICLSAVGSANLMLMAQVHQVGGLTDVLERIRRTLPDAVVVDQRLVLRAYKSWGRLLDSAGHAIGVVPVDPWASVSGSTS